MELSALVTLPDATLVTRLGADGFVAHSKNGPVRIASVETDRAPRRILFLVETGKRVIPAARKLQAAILSEILSKARPDDSFALLTVGGPRKETRFGAGNETLQVAATEIQAGLRGKNQDNAVLDGILEAIDWFQPHLAGDSIMLLTMGIEHDHEASFTKARAGLARTHVRLFGFQLGQFISGYYRVVIGTSPGGQMIPIASVDPNHQNFFALSRGTGGFAGLENAQGDPQEQYKLTDDRLKAVKYFGMQEYKAVGEYYRIRIQRPPQDLSLDLAEPIRKQLPEARVIYANTALDCSPAPSSPSP
jgi:hypothetical protein